MSRREGGKEGRREGASMTEQLGGGGVGGAKLKAKAMRVARTHASSLAL